LQIALRPVAGAPLLPVRLLRRRVPGEAGGLAAGGAAAARHFPRSAHDGSFLGRQPAGGVFGAVPALTACPVLGAFAASRPVGLCGLAARRPCGLWPVGPVARVPCAGAGAGCGWGVGVCGGGVLGSGDGSGGCRVGVGVVGRGCVMAVRGESVWVGCRALVIGWVSA
jgi:hypothetical protein